MQDKLISLIMVNYNGVNYIGKKDLIQAINSFLKTDYPNFEFIFVDNGSQDDSIKIVRKNFSYNNKIKYKLIRNSTNLGFAGACEIGIKASKGEYICLINNDDCALNKEWLKKLVREIKKKEVGAVFAKKLKWDNPKIIDAAGLTINRIGMVTQIGTGEKDEGQYDIKKECLIWQTPVLINKSILKKIGGLFDNTYVSLNDDTDSSLRIWLAGYKIIYVPKSVVVHKRSATMKHLPVEFIAFHGRKNTMQTILKNYSTFNIIKYLPITLFIYLSSIPYYLIKGRRDQAIASVKAIIWNIQNITSILSRHQDVQKRIRIKSDEIIFKLMAKIDFIKIVKGNKVWPR